MMWETLYQLYTKVGKNHAQVGNFENSFPAPQAYSVKVLSQKWETGKLFFSFFLNIEFNYVFQKIFIKKVSHFPTYGIEPYSLKGFKGGKLFQKRQKLSQFAEKFPTLLQLVSLIKPLWL